MALGIVVAQSINLKYHVLYILDRHAPIMISCKKTTRMLSTSPKFTGEKKPFFHLNEVQQGW